MDYFTLFGCVFLHSCKVRFFKERVAGGAGSTFLWLLRRAAEEIRPLLLACFHCFALFFDCGGGADIMTLDSGIIAVLANKNDRGSHFVSQWLQYTYRRKFLCIL